MKTKAISIDIPSDLLLTLNESENELKMDIKLALAIQLYVKQKLTIGKAAQVAGLPRMEFEEVLSQSNIPVSALDADDVLADLKKLK